MRSDPKQLLLVDDRAKYANVIADFFSDYGYRIDRAVTAREGIGIVKEKGLDYYRVIVTDITMERQLAGLELVYFLFRNRYAGTVVMSSTGFDVFMGMFFSKLFMGIFGVHYLVPKESVLKREFIFYRARPGSSPQRTFLEIGSI